MQHSVVDPTRQRELDRRFISMECLVCGGPRPIDDVLCEEHTTRTVRPTARASAPTAGDDLLRRGIEREAKRRGVTRGAMSRALRAGLPIGAAR